MLISIKPRNLLEKISLHTFEIDELIGSSAEKLSAKSNDNMGQSVIISEKLEKGLNEFVKFSCYSFR